MPNQNYRREADALGQFGQFGGRFVAESLMPLVLQLEQAYNEARAEPAFIAELDQFNAEFVGRPSPLYFAERLTEQYGGAKIFPPMACAAIADASSVDARGVAQCRHGARWHGCVHADAPARSR